MLKGMTGYVERQKKIKGWVVSVEIWSYNHKFLRLKLSLPDNIRKYSKVLEKKVREKFHRGKITLKINFYDCTGREKREVVYDHNIAKEIYNLIKKEDEKGKISMADVLMMPDVLNIEKAYPTFEKMDFHINRLVAGAVNDLDAIRKSQGRIAEESLRKNIKQIKKSLRKIKQIHKKDKNNFTSSLKDKIKDISSKKANEDILQEETINFIRNCEIEEEVTRIESYIRLLGKLLRVKKTVGRRIDFIGQELLREANTIGAKKDNFFVKEKIVNIKESIEKIREHSHNIE